MGGSFSSAGVGDRVVPEGCKTQSSDPDWDMGHSGEERNREGLVSESRRLMGESKEAQAQGGEVKIL